MSSRQIFSCYIIGDNSLTLKCAEIILNSGHSLFGLISSAEEIKEWCFTNNIPHFTDIIEFKSKQPQVFDYLFSIINAELLSKEILSLPKKFAINYHDAPLPKYAGLYATTHAILNNEKQHAVSWHIMQELVDAGDILQQRFFSIADNETALSLNLKCYEQAIHSFDKLVIDLETNNLKPIKQNLNNRSYFSLKNKPPNLGFIKWDQPAEEIDKLCRALTLGNYPNKLGLPKLIINNKIFVLTDYKKLKISSNLPPGTISYICDKTIQVATQTFDIQLSGIMDITGKKYSLSTLCENFKLKVNLKLPEIKNEILESIANNQALKPAIEKFWVNEFSATKEQLKFSAQLEKNSITSHKKVKTVKIPSNHLQKIKAITSVYKLTDVLFTILLIYLYRLNNYQNLSIKYISPILKQEPGVLNEFLSNFIPLTTMLHKNISFFEALKIIINKKNELSKKSYFTNDIFIRYPKLSNILHKIDINILITNTPNFTYHDGKLNICIAADGLWVSFIYFTKIKSPLNSCLYLRNIHKNFLELLKEIALNPNKPIFRFSIINKKEKNNLMSIWNNTEKKYSFKKLLHQHFEAQVKKTPKSVALIFNNVSINYEELNQKANKLAHYLTASGVKSNDIIGIYLERGPEMVISILAILKAGGAYLPLDTNHPEKRIAHILKHSKTNLVLLADKLLINKIAKYVKKTIDINEITTLTYLSNENLVQSNNCNNLAYIIYTSGTTGNPKGVAVSHKAICNHMLWMQTEYQFNKNDIFLQKTPLLLMLLFGNFLLLY